MEHFWVLLEKSTITSGILAILLVSVTCYCAVAQIPIPDYLALALGTVIGFFFSSKAKDSERELKKKSGSN